jgi:phosphoribosylaminoimidazolecarboxamide formyltransferase/IMP cyclohydrolase
VVAAPSSGSASPVAIGVLVSGSGTILEAILDAGLPVSVVVADRPCRALGVAADAGVPGSLVDRAAFGGFGPGFDRPAYTEAVVEALAEHHVDVVVMAGYGTVLDQPIHTAYPGRILNTHPALLPAFPGWHAVRDALAEGVAETGTTVHIATLAMDAGPVLAQEAVPVFPDDTEATLHERIKAVERVLYPATIRSFIDKLAVPAGDERGSPMEVKAMKALLSVYDKTGLVELARGLADLGWELVSSGGTSSVLADAGLPHREVADLTGAPEMLGGRVKTLHPAIHGGILADRSQPGHLSDLEDQDIDLIDLVVCNLYPFRSDPSIELIDVGGPTMVRAAAKNHAHVGVVVDPSEYGGVLSELKEHGTLSDATRFRLARDAFAHTAAYDAAIVGWFDQRGAPATGATPEAESEAAILPPTIHLTLERAGSLRYGENPHQHGARYRIDGEHSWWDDVVQYGGKELSYLNLFDADAAWRLVHELVTPGGTEVAAAIIKHANPCGASLADTLAIAYQRALDGDPLSAFGGIVALGGPVTVEVAEAIGAGPQADVIIAPSYDEAALALLSSKRKATRLLSAPSPEPIVRQYRGMGSTVLVQDADRFLVDPSQWEVATTTRPTDAQWRDLALAWKVCARTTSNAIAIVRGGQAVGVGAGQSSRVVAAEIAASKAGDRALGAAAASDAFFPFPDGLEVLAAAGVAVVVQPGGSIRDGEVTAAADAAGVALVMAGGERHFRH